MDQHRFRRGIRSASFALVLFVAAAISQAQDVVDHTAHAMHDHAAMASSTAAASDDGFFTNLLKVYTPRRVCMNYETGLIWLHLISDALIMLAYFSIPFALVYFVRRRRNLAFNWIFVCFAIFILACGTTHLINIIAIWTPVYRLDGIVKLITAIASIGTATILWPLIPKAIALPSPSQLRLANESLAHEIAERKQAEAKLQRMHDELEIRVNERTAELKTANEKLLEEMKVRKEFEISRARLAAIVESSEDAIIGKSLDGKITDWNRGANELFGYESADIVGQSILTIVPAERHDEERDILVKIGRGDRVEQFETVRISKTGRPIDVSLTVSPILDADRQIIGASASARDITLQKEAERERERLLANERVARSEAEHANRMKDEFLATLSHELRTPLNAILGWSQILLRSKGQTDDVRQGLDVIDRNARAQVRLVEDLLDMSRILTGTVRLDVQPVSLPGVIQAALDAVRPAADAKEIVIQPVLDPQAAAVTGDPARLQQIIWNLLINAIKFTPKGGRVQIFLERVNSQIEVTVTDSGEGIKPEFLPYVFERFRQADPSTTRRHGGLGLGLAIVRHLVELHGGRVSVKSEGLGRGASFIVALPLRPLRLQNEPGMPRIHPETGFVAGPDGDIPSLAGLKVLVVDDEADSREIIRIILTEHGAKVITAGSVSQAMQLLRDESPDVVCSDIGMPEEDGYSLIRRIRKLPAAEGGNTPAVALTAFARSEDRRVALMSGFQMHVVKPAEPAELVTVIASIAQRRS
ncbi:MAG: ATP-binding protein [Tepidisphaeraceae bacterium]